jgi:hypothetical protein
MNVTALAPYMAGEDFAAMGLVQSPDIDTRSPGQPAYALRLTDVSPFLLYWGFMYNADGKAAPLKQDVRTGQMYGLVSKDQQGRAVVLNGLRVIFYSEALHVSCKVAEVSAFHGDKLLGMTRTQHVEKAVSFLKKLRPDWGGFVDQSTLVDLSILSNRSDPEILGQSVHRRLMEVTKVQSVTAQVLDIDPEAESDFGEAEAPKPVVSDPNTQLPAWPSELDSDFLSMSPELMEPPTKQDRPMVVQFMVEGNPNPFTGSSRVPDNVLSEIRRHVGYWLPVYGHRKDDCHQCVPCESGFQLTLGMKLFRDAGLDKNNRKSWLEDALTALKLQIESGTRPKQNGTVTCPAVSVKILKARAAYP